MATEAINAADDTLTLFGRNIIDFAEGDTSAFTYPNEKVTMNTGKNGNTTYAFNEAGINADLSLRLLRGSADDRFLQEQLTAQDRDRAAFNLATGRFVKRIGDGQGNVVSDTLTLNGGIFVRNVDTKENVSGDTEQAVSVYTLRFSRAERSIE